jgi:hypothetical protein
MLYFSVFYVWMPLTCLLDCPCRGADSQATDGEGRTALQYAIDSGTIDDEEILVLLEDPGR